MNVRPLTITMVALALVAGSSCSSSPNATNSPPSSPDAAGVRAVVAIVGDSNVSQGGRWDVWDLTRGQGGLLSADHLDNNYVPLFVARPGAGIRSPDCAAHDLSCPNDDFWAEKLRATFARVRVNAVVTDLGINDAFTRGTAATPGYADYAAKIDYFMRLVPHGVVVLWTNLPCSIEPSTLRAGCAAINQALSAAVARWPNLSIIDWAAVADAHASYMDANAPSSLRVHYSDSGDATWARVVTRALDAKFPVR
jgi:hypothetical protein